jgi:cardiolipin synthase (CMP-forming)
VQIVGVTTVLVMQVWAVPGAVPFRRFLMHSIAVLAPASAAHYAWLVLRRIQSPQPQESAFTTDRHG